MHPSNFDITIHQVRQQLRTVYLENRTNQSVPITVDLRNFTAQGEEGAVDLTTEDTTYSLAKWITVSPTIATIQPNESQNSPLRLLLQ